MSRPLRIFDVLRHSAKFNLATVFAQALALPKGIIIALVLSPHDYGVMSFVALWSTYAGLVTPGFITLSGREMPALLGAKNEAEALRTQNIAYSGELVFSLFTFLVIFAAGFFYSETAIKWGIILLAFQFVSSKVSQMYSTTLQARHAFGTVALANALYALLDFLIVIALVFWLKVYGIFVSLTIVSFCIAIYYVRKSSINFRFDFDPAALRRMFGVSLFLVLQGIAYWGYRLTDKTVISSTLPLEQLGYYSFAMTFVLFPLTFFIQFGTTLQPMLWRQAGAVTSDHEAFGIGKRIIVYLVLLSSILAPALQAGFYFLVTFVTPKYVPSISIFTILSLYLVSHLIMQVPSLILNSKKVGRQKMSLVTYAVGLALNIIFCVLAVRNGYGIMGVAVATVAAQLCISLWNYFLVKRYLFDTSGEVLRNLFLVALPLLVATGFTLANLSFPVSVTSMLLSVAAQAVLWPVIILLFYNEYISRSGIGGILGEARKTIPLPFTRKR